jgi:hypothetical protein
MKGSYAMKIFEFEKQGFKFFFRNPEFNRYGKLIMNYKIPGIAENKHDLEGYFYNSEFLPDKNVMTFCSVKINNKSIGGVELPEDISKEVKDLLIQFKTERENNINQVVKELITGKRNIYFSIVGCDYPYYQPWVKNLPKDLNGIEQDIMTKTIKIIVGEEEYVGNSCDYLQKIVNKDIGTIESLGDIFNPEFEEKSQEYHGYKKTIVTGFEMNLVDILQSTKEQRIKERRITEVEKQTREDRQAQFNIKKVYRQINPKGGEDGQDGYYDADITDGKNTVRFVARNVFDFGFYTYPKRLEGTDNIFKVENWTEFEERISNWLTEFSPFTTGIRM